MNTKNQHILVLGMGVSGSAAARLMLSEGNQVVIVDKNPQNNAENAVALKDAGARIENNLDAVINEPFDLCIVSPGIAVEHPWLEKIRDSRIPVLPEFEIGWFRTTGKTIAVTGSNGKSTVVKWISEALRKSGKRALACGNYGFPVCDVVGQRIEPEFLVVELSSFQLEHMMQFRPDAALLLNVLPNHLDRHGDIDEYRRIKLRIFEHLREDRPAVIPEELFEEASALYPDRNWVTFGAGPNADFRYENAHLFYQGQVIADLSGTLYGNDIMGPSAAGAVALLMGVGVPLGDALGALQKLESLPHRQQEVMMYNGVRFVNDSKATNLAAMCAAISSCKGPIRLIAGGQAKEKDFNSVKEVLAKHVKSVYLVGKDAQNMADVWNDVVSCVMCETLDRAVDSAWADTSAGETILFSPGCTSYDQFNNFEERGNVYIEKVRSLNMEIVK